MEGWTRIPLERGYVDKGYAGHNYDKPERVIISGQRRGLTPTMKRELKRRSALKATIGHMKTDGRLGRFVGLTRRHWRHGSSSLLKGRDGDRINAILVGAGYNYRLVLKWLRLLLARIMAVILKAIQPSLTAPVATST